MLWARRCFLLTMFFFFVDFFSLFTATMASVLDYSKWDNLTLSSDEEEEEPSTMHNRSSWKPTVHRLDKPTSVTFGGPESKVDYDSTQKSVVASTPTISKKTATPQSSTPVNNFTTNGASTDTHSWSQTRTEVILRVYIPFSLGGKNIKLQIPNERTLSIQIVGNSTVEPLAPLLVTGNLSFPIVPVPDAMDIDWEIERNKNSQNKKESCCVRVTVLKKVVSTQLIVWWNRVYEEEEVQIDVKTIEGRKSGGVEGMNKAQSVWAEAHKMFREKVAARKEAGQVGIAINDGEDGEVN